VGGDLVARDRLGVVGMDKRHEKVECEWPQAPNPAL
jgi:hypothetical protein